MYRIHGKGEGWVGEEGLKSSAKKKKKKKKDIANGG